MQVNTGKEIGTVKISQSVTIMVSRLIDNSGYIVTILKNGQVVDYVTLLDEIFAEVDLAVRSSGIEVELLATNESEITQIYVDELFSVEVLEYDDDYYPDYNVNILDVMGDEIAEEIAVPRW